MAAAAPERIALTIARRGVESTTRLGRHGWMVERSLVWLLASRRLMVPRRRADILTAYLQLFLRTDLRPYAPTVV